MGTLSVIVSEQAVCWTSNGLRGSMPTVLTFDCVWNWLKFSDKFIFSVFFSSCLLCTGKDVMWDVWKLFAFLQEFSENWLKFVKLLLSSIGCFAVADQNHMSIILNYMLKSKSNYMIGIFDRTGITQAGIQCSLAFGATHGHWLKLFRLKPFLCDISRKFR